MRDLVAGDEAVSKLRREEGREDDDRSVTRPRIHVVCACIGHCHELMVNSYETELNGFRFWEPLSSNLSGLERPQRGTRNGEGEETDDDKGKVTPTRLILC